MAAIGDRWKSLGSRGIRWVCGGCWELLGSVEVDGCDDFGGGFAFEGCAAAFGGWVMHSLVWNAYVWTDYRGRVFNE
jgi:hypothetical protein